MHVASSFQGYARYSATRCSQTLLVSTIAQSLQSVAHSTILADDFPTTWKRLVQMKNADATEHEH